jgi:leucyl-tRNA synthetase
MVTARSYQNEAGSYVSPDDVEEKEGHYFHRKTKEKLRSQIDKMSKSKLNGVSPDEIIEEFGADSLRLYEMFMGPLEKEKTWSTEAVTGCRRFLSRFYDMIFSDKVTDADSEEALRLGYRLVAAVCRDIEEFHFNTAIAKMMEFVNDFTKLAAYPRKVLKMAIQCLAPFAPHIAEELWEKVGGVSNLSTTPYPVIEERYLEDETTTYVVQINGKVRGQFVLPKNQSKEAMMKLALEHPGISKHVTGEIKKMIFVPDKLINLVL